MTPPSEEETSLSAEWQVCRYTNDVRRTLDLGSRIETLKLARYAADEMPSLLRWEYDHAALWKLPRGTKAEIEAIVLASMPRIEGEAMSLARARLTKERVEERGYALPWEKVA